MAGIQGLDGGGERLGVEVTGAKLSAVTAAPGQELAALNKRQRVVEPTRNGYTHFVSQVDLGRLLHALVVSQAQAPAAAKTPRVHGAAHAAGKIVCLAAGDFQHTLPAQPGDLYGLRAYLPLVSTLLQQLVYPDACASGQTLRATGQGDSKLVRIIAPARKDSARTGHDHRMVTAGCDYHHLMVPQRRHDDCHVGIVRVRPDQGISQSNMGALQRRASA